MKFYLQEETLTVNRDFSRIPLYLYMYEKSKLTLQEPFQVFLCKTVHDQTPSALTKLLPGRGREIEECYLVCVDVLFVSQ